MAITTTRTKDEFIALCDNGNLESELPTPVYKASLKMF